MPAKQLRNHRSWGETEEEVVKTFTQWIVDQKLQKIHQLWLWEDERKIVTRIKYLRGRYGDSYFVIYLPILQSFISFNFPHIPSLFLPIVINWFRNGSSEFKGRRSRTNPFGKVPGSLGLNRIKEPFILVILMDYIHHFRNSLFP